MNVNPGKLDKRISIVLNTVSDEKDEDGFPIGEKKEIIRSCWASFKRTSGTEKAKAGKELSETECRFLIRWTSVLIDTGMQVEYAGENYDILFVNDYEDSHEYMEIWCKKVD